MKRFVALLLILIITAPSVSAKRRTIDPLTLFPTSTHGIVQVDLSTVPVGDMASAYIPGAEDFSATLLKTLTRLKATIGFTLDTEPRIYGAIPMTKTVYTELQTLADMETSNAVQFGDAHAYYCESAVGENCYTYLGGHALFTTTKQDMDMLIKNYRNGTQGSVAQSPEFKKLDMSTPKNSTVSFKLMKARPLASLLNSTLKSTSHSFLLPKMYSFDISANNTSLDFLSKAHYQKNQLPSEILGFQTRDFTMSPRLYTYTDPRDRIGFIEARNLFKSLEAIITLPDAAWFRDLASNDDTMTQELDTIDTAFAPYEGYLDYFKQITGNYVLTLHANTANMSELPVSFTLLSEIHPNAKRTEVISSLDELTENLSIMAGEQETQITFANANAGAYIATFPASDDETENFTLYYGVNENNQFYITTDMSHILSTPVRDSILTKYFGTSPELVSVGHVLFGSIFDAISASRESMDNMEASYGLEKLHTLDSLLFKESADETSVVHNLRLNFTEPLVNLFKQ